MIPSAANQAQVEYWNGRAGRHWSAWQDELDRTMAPISEALLSGAGIVDGERVLDVGCGCGATTLAIAERTGDRGRVTGVDVSEQMLARARERLQARSNVTLELADAAEAALPRVDLVCSRFGVMFFADPVRAFAHLRSTGGRLRFACWRPPAENAWATIPAAAVAPFVASEPPAAADAPGPFAFADPTRVRTILAAAGWCDVELAPVDVPLRWGSAGTLDAAVEMFRHVGPASRRLAESPDPARGIAALGEALRPHLTPEGARLDGAIWIVTAKPAPRP